MTFCQVNTITTLTMRNPSTERAGFIDFERDGREKRITLEPQEIKHIVLKTGSLLVTTSPGIVLEWSS